MEQLGPISEALDTELKGWLDLSDARHGAMIARACIALRNNGGGRLILGIEDKTLRSSDSNRPKDVAGTYHPDALNTLVGKYALPKFEVRVQIKVYEGQEHPEITVSGGVDFPVISRAPFEKELRQNAVYVRTITNGRPSSEEPRTPQDWERLIGICFDNREADIGRFFRRHLGGIATELQKCGAIAAPAMAFELPLQTVCTLLDTGRAQFKERLAKSGVGGPAQAVGYFEVAAVLSGSFEAPSVRDLLNKVFSHQPHMTGWPTWVDSRGFRDTNSHPYVTQGAWEALVHRVRDQWSEDSLDFWKMEPCGRFYLLRTLEDDTSRTLQGRGVKPGTIFDFLLLVSRTTEAIGTIRGFAEGLGVNRSDGSVDFAFRWTGLRGREITCWVDLSRELMTRVKAMDDQVVSTCCVPLDIPDKRLWEFVKQITQPVFDVFGTGIGDQVLQDIVDRTLSRRL